MEYITKVPIITIIVLVMVVSFFGYQIYQLNNNLSILKTDLLNIGALISSATYGSSQQSSANSNEAQFAQPLTIYTAPSVQNQSTEQSGQQSGAGGGEGGGQGGQGGGGSQSAFQNPITSALLPDPSTLLPV
ncbi:MAG TPA: hypothetical protein VLE21_01300, partial [Candidatus Nitrosocosmicus sp.]|nr:hypothetical protein [Candidatus Nitrosocosmicus sp.]